MTARKPKNFFILFAGIIYLLKIWFAVLHRIQFGEKSKKTFISVILFGYWFFMQK